MKFLKSFIVLSAALFAAACDSDNNNRNNQPQQEFFQLQVLHAVADAPTVNVYIDGNEVLSDVAYGESSALLGLVARATPYSVRVEANIPGAPNGVMDVIPATDIAFAADTIYTIAAVGSAATGVTAAIGSQPETPVDAGAARLFVLHGAEGAPTVDVFVTAPGADLSASAPAGTFSFGESIGPASVPAGDYQVRVTPENTPGTVVFDSGTITLNAGDDLTLTAVPNVRGGDAVVNLLAQNGQGAFAILDVNTPTSFQVIHASPDAPAVDIRVNGDILVPGLEFPMATGFVEVPADTYTVAVEAMGTPVIGPVDLDLAAGTRYSILAVNRVANIAPLILTDDPLRFATNARVRLVHASPTARDLTEFVDIYVTAVGADITNETPAFADVPYLANTGYVPLPEGEYDVTITAAGTKAAAIGPKTISISNNGIYTAIARDPEPGMTDLDVILTDDFAQ